MREPENAPLALGIDLGSVGIKAVLYRGGIVDAIVAPTGWNPREAGAEAMNALLDRNGLVREQVSRVVATGYGRNAFPSDDRVTEITCHAAGAAFLHPEARVVLDIGGQDSKAILLDRDGCVRDFLMNDKCAAGTGRFLQMMATLLEYDLSDFSAIPADVAPQPISSMCTVFAESEVVSLLARGVDKQSLALGLLDSVAGRAAGMLQKLGGDGPVAFTGGVSRSSNLARLLQRRLGRPVLVSAEAQIAGALGAAIIAARKAERSRDAAS